jgi:uncharacterized protein involved in oxidation of intracellular sulfur
VKFLMIINDPPYGTERAYNALRLALALRKQDAVQLKVFLLADAVGCARAGQQVPEGFYSLERMLKGLTVHGVQVGACGTCLDARGLRQEDLLEGVQRSTMDELAAWTLEADRVIVF